MNRTTALKRWAGWALPLAWMGIIFLFSSQPDRPHLAETFLDRLVEPLGHVFEYGMLAYLWARRLRAEGSTKRRAAWAALVLSASYALFDEWHQTQVPSRQADPLDLVLDALGMGFSVWAWSERR